MGDNSSPRVKVSNMSYFGQGTTSSPRIIFTYLQPCPQLGIEEGSRHQATFKLLNWGFNCEECDDKCPSGKELVNHWKILHSQVAVGYWKMEPHCEVRPAGKGQGVGQEAVVIGVDPDTLLADNLDVGTLFECEAYIALEFHTKDKPFSCKSCNKIFSKMKKLREHGKIHRNPKKCSYCEKIFPSDYKRARHEVIHTRKIPE